MGLTTRMYDGMSWMRTGSVSGGPAADRPVRVRGR